MLELQQTAMNYDNRDIFVDLDLSFMTDYNMILYMSGESI